MKKCTHVLFFPLSVIVFLGAPGCGRKNTIAPSFSSWPKATEGSSQAVTIPRGRSVEPYEPKARLRFASGEVVEDINVPTQIPLLKNSEQEAEKYTDLSTESVLPRPYQNDEKRTQLTTRPSLYREGRGVANDPYHDYRAFQPFDLVTIVITELAEGNRVANTNAKSESTFKTALRGLLGFDNWIFGKNKGLDPSALIDASSETEFKGQGQTLRSDRLKGTISAVVTEVLPSGVLAIEGKKIITVNGEAQTMILSGLVRPRDVKSNNTVESSKVANMQIDFFGEGTIGDVQKPGWLYSFILWIWPF